MLQPLVSVIINCYNQSHYLDRCVKSVIYQTFTNLECIIIDDGSTDNTHAISLQLANLDSRIKYYYKENGGLPAARNFGLTYAQGEWIQYLDADDWIHPDKIKFQLNYLSQIKDTSENIVFYSDYIRVFFDKNNQIIENQTNIIGNLNSQALIQRLLIPDFLANSPHPALQQCMLIHKNIFSNSKFPEHLKALGDRYFALDILNKGTKFIYVPIIAAFYTKHQSNRTNSWNYMKNYYILFYETVYKHYPEQIKISQIGLEFLVSEAIRDKEETNFKRLLNFLPLPIYLANKKLKIYNLAHLKTIYLMRNIIPSFLIYEKYRGSRSKKILSILHKLAYYHK